MKKAIVMCTYNEADNICQILDELSKYDIIIVDDNSPDGTGLLVSRYTNVKLITRQCKLGIASAYLTGMREAINDGYEIIMQMDAGGTHKPCDVKRMFVLSEKNNAELIVGSRFLNKHKFMGLRTILSKTARYMMDIIGIKQTDATSGFRCWKSSLLKNINFDLITAKGFSFQLQMLYYSSKITDKIIEYPIEYKLTNSSLSLSIIIEALFVYFRLFIKTIFGRKKY